MYCIDLSGKVALVTGASRGIGRATSKLLAKAGATVYITGRDIDRLENVASDIRATEGNVHSVVMDVTQPASVSEAFKLLFREQKRIDILINNAGVLDDALLPMVTSDQIERTFSTNVFGMIYCCQYAARLMERTGGGSIINLSSIIGTNGNEGQVVYGASKAAVIGLTRSLAKELAPKKIRVNAIAPGFIDTDMARSIPQDKFEERMNSIKMGRIGLPEDVALTVLFLSSDMSSYITGQIIGVDGGMLI